jgi:hypothetical protein
MLPTVAGATLLSRTVIAVGVIALAPLPPAAPVVVARSLCRSPASSQLQLQVGVHKPSSLSINFQNAGCSRHQVSPSGAITIPAGRIVERGRVLEESEMGLARWQVFRGRCRCLWEETERRESDHAGVTGFYGDEERGERCRDYGRDSR